MYTIDQPGDVDRGSLDGVAAAVTFAPGDAGAQFAQLRALRPEQRPLCGEYWAGWFDHWGEPHAQLDASLQERDLQWMLANGVSVNVYMLHGGTNFALWNGANAFEPHPYQPTTTSYDYQAAIDESGCATEKYLRFREIIVAHTGEPPKRVPAAMPQCGVEPFVMDRAWPMRAALHAPVTARVPLTMEQLGISRGFVCYRTTIERDAHGLLEVEARDYTVVLVDGRIAGVVDRRFSNTPLNVEARRGSTLELLCENLGRINYGPAFPHEWKGIRGGVRIGGEPLHEWEMFALTPQPPVLRGAPETQCADAPAFYAGSFDLREPGDTFFDMRELRKGILWINGRCAGRYWHEGPQLDLYVPAPWLRAGRNEALVFETQILQDLPRLRGATAQERVRYSTTPSRAE
jgi:beta-galactosidase